MATTSISIKLQTPRKMRSALTLVALLIVVAIIFVVFAGLLLLPFQRSAPEAARRNQCQNNHKQIAIALLDYANDHGALPPAYTTDADGKPLHSWRTLILPYMEEKALYDSIDLTKPWDDPANAIASRTAVAAYVCPSSLADDHFTNYLAVVTPDSCLHATDPRKLTDISDPPHHTLLLIEVDGENAVPWMSPHDANEDLVLALGGSETRSPHHNGRMAVFLDGHTEFLLDDVAADHLRAIISIAGGEDSSL